ncbi:MAG TPA: SRPBCC domain-containing protein [Solirubrobacteraceae bacterium]|nr:SRPBCC domain-containing protein [Solirubrobacteraceae bacterium]
MVRREVVLPVDLDAAWANLAEAEGLEGWLADEIDLDVRPGADGTARWSDGTERHVVVDEIEVGRRLALYWWAEGEDATLVELTLDEHDDGTRLVVVEVPVRVVEAVGAGLPTGGAARGPQLAAA